MNKLLADNKEAVKAILGWCAFNSGGRVTGTRPEGYETKNMGDGWNEEMWCYDRVEATLRAYKEAYQPFGYANIAAMQMRRWLNMIFWDSVELSKMGEFEHVVFAEIVRFKKMVKEEADKHPRPKFFEVA